MSARFFVFTLGILSLSTFPSWASTSSQCFEKVAEHENARIPGRFPKMTKSQLECLDSNVHFDTTLRGLCNEDQSDLAAKYRKYLVYEKQHRSKFEAFQNATTPAERSAAAFDLQRIEQEWLLFGFRSEIAAHLNRLNTARSNCRIETQS